MRVSPLCWVSGLQMLSSLAVRVRCFVANAFDWCSYKADLCNVSLADSFRSQWTITTSNAPKVDIISFRLRAKPPLMTNSLDDEKGPRSFPTSQNLSTTTHTPATKVHTDAQVSVRRGWTIDAICWSFHVKTKMFDTAFPQCSTVCCNGPWQKFTSHSTQALTSVSLTIFGTISCEKNSALSKIGTCVPVLADPVRVMTKSECPTSGTLLGRGHFSVSANSAENPKLLIVEIKRPLWRYLRCSSLRNCVQKASGFAFDQDVVKISLSGKQHAAMKAPNQLNKARAKNDELYREAKMLGWMRDHFLHLFLSVSVIFPCSPNLCQIKVRGQQTILTWKWRIRTLLLFPSWDCWLVFLSLRSLQDENILKLEGVCFEDDTTALIITEYASNGEHADSQSFTPTS